MTISVHPDHDCTHDLSREEVNKGAVDVLKKFGLDENSINVLDDTVNLSIQILDEK